MEIRMIDLYNKNIGDELIIDSIIYRIKNIYYPWANLQTSPLYSAITIVDQNNFVHYLRVTY